MRRKQKGIYGLMKLASYLSILCGLASTFSETARAQRSPAGLGTQADISIDYSYVRARPASGGAASNLQGGSASAAFYFHHGFGLVADIGGNMFTGQRAGLSAQMYTYLFGPRFTFRRSEKFVPFAQALFGGGRLNASSGSVQAGENAFALSLGGGLDIGVGHRFAIRAIQAEYLITHFPNVVGTTVTQNNYRLSAGIVLRFGGRQSGIWKKRGIDFR
jgi:hypothetical protein